MADEYYSGSIPFRLPVRVEGYQEYMVSDALYSIAPKNEIPVYAYHIPYPRVEEFIATVTGGEQKKPRPGVPQAPGPSKIRRRVTG